MTVSHKSAKEYLSQSHKVEQRITIKLEHMQVLRELAEKASASLSDVPPSGTRNVHRLEDTICQIANLENEINADIQTLIGLKHEIVKVIRRVESPDLQIILELRYLGFKTWKEIAVSLRRDLRWIYRLHDKALKVVDEIRHV
jgi:hypothetical protein